MPRTIGAGLTQTGTDSPLVGGGDGEPVAADREDDNAGVTRAGCCDLTCGRTTDQRNPARCRVDRGDEGLQVVALRCEDDQQLGVLASGDGRGRRLGCRLFGR
jgi:hypothetical protein